MGYVDTIQNKNGERYIQGGGGELIFGHISDGTVFVKNLNTNRWVQLISPEDGDESDLVTKETATNYTSLEVVDFGNPGPGNVSWSLTKSGRTVQVKFLLESGKSPSLTNHFYKCEMYGLLKLTRTIEGSGGASVAETVYYPSSNNPFFFYVENSKESGENYSYTYTIQLPEEYLHDTLQSEYQQSFGFGGPSVQVYDCIRDTIIIN